MLLSVVAALVLSAPAAPTVRLAVPLIRQAPERCGPASLQMVLRFYGADSAAVVEAERAYDPVLRGALITDLAAAARRGGFDAEVATLNDSALIDLLSGGVPPIVLYQNGPVVTVRHFAVVAGWVSPTREFILHDGAARARSMRREELIARWRAAGSQALIVRRGRPAVAR
ncbi:MAG: hypothetical protein HYR73_01280 [Candidatus Eisenbacteria bacterium]|nr:hypothetical protein [Candidatus Eisenbacteria bacterium]